MGQEGLAGLPVLLGGMSYSHQVLVQVAGTAWWLPAALLLTEFHRQSVLHGLLLRYIQAMLTQARQNGACHRFHTTEARLARWLLLASDSLGADTFRLAPACLGQMLGLHPTDATVAAGVFSQAGFVRYRRGRMTLVDRAGLEAFACECYGVVRAAFAAV